MRVREVGAHLRRGAPVNAGLKPVTRRFRSVSEVGLLVDPLQLDKRIIQCGKVSGELVPHAAFSGRATSTDLNAPQIFGIEVLVKAPLSGRLIRQLNGRRRLVGRRKIGVEIQLVGSHEGQTRHWAESVESPTAGLIAVGQEAVRCAEIVVVVTHAGSGEPARVKRERHLRERREGEHLFQLLEPQGASLGRRPAGRHPRIAKFGTVVPLRRHVKPGGPLHRHRTCLADARQFRAEPGGLSAEVDNPKRNGIVEVPPGSPTRSTKHLPPVKLMLECDATLPLGRRLAPPLSDGQASHAPRIIASVCLVERAGALSKRHVKEIKHPPYLSVRRYGSAHNQVGPTNFGFAVFAVAIGLNPVSVEQIARPTRRPVDLDLLSVVSVATELDIGLDLKRRGGRERRPETDHPAGRIAIQHRIRTPDDFNPVGGAEVKVRWLRRAIRGGKRNTVLKHLNASHPESDHGCSDRGLHTARKAEVAPVFSKQTRNTSQRFSQSLLALSELNFVTFNDSNRSWYRASLLQGPCHCHGFGKRQDFQRDVQRLHATHDDRDRRRLGSKPRHDCVDLVVTGWQLKQLEASLPVACNATGNICFEICGRHGHPRHNRVGFITNRSLNSALSGLGFGDRNRRSTEERQAHQQGNHVTIPLVVCLYVLRSQPKSSVPFRMASRARSGIVAG